MKCQFLGLSTVHSWSYMLIIAFLLIYSQHHALKKKFSRLKISQSLQFHFQFVKKKCLATIRHRFIIFTDFLLTYNIKNQSRMIKTERLKLRIKKRNRYWDKKAITVRKIVLLFRKRVFLRKIKHNSYVGT